MPYIQHLGPLLSIWAVYERCLGFSLLPATFGFFRWFLHCSSCFGGSRCIHCAAGCSVPSLYSLSPLSVMHPGTFIVTCSGRESPPSFVNLNEHRHEPTKGEHSRVHGCEERASQCPSSLNKPGVRSEASAMRFVLRVRCLIGSRAHGLACRDGSGSSGGVFVLARRVSSAALYTVFHLLRRFANVDFPQLDDGCAELDR